MHCPVCQIHLRLDERFEVEFDSCPRCRGVWLERGELEQILERAAQPVQFVPLDERLERRGWNLS